MSNKVRLHIEKHFSFYFTMLTCIVLWLCRNCSILIYLFNNRLSDKDFLAALLTLSSIIFGFLLTTIIFLLQSESKSICIIKKLNRVNDLIKYNKKAVYSSFVTVVFTTIIMLLGDRYNIDWLKSVWIYTTIYSAISSAQFLQLFFKLIMN